MSALPIVAHHTCRPAAGDSRRAKRLAEDLLQEHPRLMPEDVFRPLLPRGLEIAPALHVDDLAEIPLLDRGWIPTCLEDRARLRAVDGDLVATCAAADPSYEAYCERALHLGRVSWLHPRADNRPLSVAMACWRDPAIRDRLVRAVRADRLRYVHPHMGSFAVWAVSSLLSRAARRPVSVIAPPPGVTRFVNDKLHFADVVRRLFGLRTVPTTVEANNYAALARVVQQLAPAARSIAVKVPDSAGGRGNFVLPSRQLRDRSVGRIRHRLKKMLRDLPWEPGDRLLVSAWESDVLEAPSTQLWIPPEQDGAPVVEGLFLQWVEGRQGAFAGAHPARLPQPIERELVDRSWLLGRLFQRLGYVGRCSFDAILVGRDLSSCRMEFLECNGRWGGTSTPMTLMNRLFGDWARRPFASHKCVVPGLDGVRFGDVLTGLGTDLFDASTGRGWAVLYTPGRMKDTSGLDLIALGDTWSQAETRARVDLPRRLGEIVEGVRTDALARNPSFGHTFTTR